MESRRGAEKDKGPPKTIEKKGAAERRNEENDVVAIPEKNNPQQKAQAVEFPTEKADVLQPKHIFADRPPLVTHKCSTCQQHNQTRNFAPQFEALQLTHKLSVTYKAYPLCSPPASVQRSFQAKGCFAKYSRTTADAAIMLIVERTVVMQGKIRSALRLVLKMRNPDSPATTGKSQPASCADS
ncbi:unnamed protein product [Caenorhabditis brenneri]